VKAWIGKRDGNGLAYALSDLPDPEPARGEVLLRVRAVGLNLVDRFPKASHFSHSPPAPEAIPGLEVAGEIASLGEGVTEHRVGDRVMSMVQGGCAQYVRAPQSLLMPVPSGMSWTDAAAVPVSFLTAHDALVTHGRMPRNGTVLIHAITTGVGLAAVQLARIGQASLVAGTSGSAGKLERTRALGLDCALLDPYAGFADEVLAATGQRGVDVVIDHIGGKLLNETLRATAIGGRVIDVGRFGGARTEIDLELLAVRRISLIGVTFRTRSLAEHASIVAAFVESHGPHLASGVLRPVVDRVLPFDALPEAIERAQRREQFGKFVLAL
jgi:NADPH:quinone reductase-like Zn-dependent oxidoreductase